MQPTQSNMLLRTASGTLPRTTTSETAKRPPGFNTRKASRENTIFVGGEIDDAVRDDDIDRVVRQRNVLDFALEELDIGDAGLPLVFTRQRQHVVRHVQTVGFAGWANALCREQHIDAAAGAEIENRLSGPKIDRARSDCRTRETP